MLTLLAAAKNEIRHSKNDKETRPSKLFAKTSGIVTADALFSYWPIGHFRVPKNLTFKARLSAKLLI